MRAEGGFRGGRAGWLGWIKKKQAKRLDVGAGTDLAGQVVSVVRWGGGCGFFEWLQQ